MSKEAAFDPSHVTVKDWEDFQKVFGRSRINGALKVRDEAIARARKWRTKYLDAVNLIAELNKELATLRAGK
jgi:hypothetical protein